MICKSIYILRVTHYTIHWDKTQTLKKFPSVKIKVTKNALFFLLQVPTHHRFNFNSQFLYKLKQKFHLSKNVSGIFSFPFCFVFIKVYIFFQQKSMDPLTLNVIFHFKIRIIEKPNTVLLQHVWFLSCNKKFENLMISAWVAAIMEAKFWVRCFFSIGIFK